MKALITGICGFAGSHLAEHLLERGDEVAGLRLPGEPDANLCGIRGRVDLHDADVTDAPAVAAAVETVRPEAVYHLAGAASVGGTWNAAVETLRVNATGFVTLALACRRVGSPPILAVGSGEMYGLVPEDRQPIVEDEPLAPRSPYALSKVWQEEAARWMGTAHDYPVVLARSFNHTGPRQAPAFVCSDFARQLARMEAGLVEPVLRVGNLAARRDFLDVRDVAVAYRLALTAGRRGVPYNIASGRAVSVREVLDLLLGLCRVTVETRQDPTRLRPHDIPVLSGDARRLSADTGWSPARDLAGALADLLEWWRGRVREEAA